MKSTTECSSLVLTRQDHSSNTLKKEYFNSTQTRYIKDYFILVSHQNLVKYQRLVYFNPIWVYESVICITYQQKRDQTSYKEDGGILKEKNWVLNCSSFLTIWELKRSGYSLNSLCQKLDMIWFFPPVEL